jgi:cytochrome c biogenesis protein CcdA
MGRLQLRKKAMHLPRKMKSKPVIFASAVAIIFFGFVFVILAIQRLEASHRPDGRLLVGAVFIIWGAWALLSFKPEDKS